MEHLAPSRTGPVVPYRELDQEPDFYSEANCRGRDEFQLIIEKEANNNEIPPEVLKIARLVCSMCWVQQECLEYGLTITSEYGMYGALTQNARQQLSQAQNIPQKKRPVHRGSVNSLRGRDG